VIDLNGMKLISEPIKIRFNWFSSVQVRSVYEKDKKNTKLID